MSLLITVVVALILIRMVCASATLRDSTFGVLLLAGALANSLAAPLMYRLIPAFHPVMALIQGVVVQGIILLPLFLAFRTRALTKVSTGDVFLMAFMAGFGFDLLSVILVRAIEGTVISVTMLPPGALTMPYAATIPGHGYWSALVALTVVAAARFLRTWRAVILAAAAALVYVSAESAVVQDKLPAEWFRQLTLHGSLTPWLALALLIAAQIRETRRGSAGWVVLFTQARAWCTHLGRELSGLQKLTSAFVDWVRTHRIQTTAWLALVLLVEIVPLLPYAAGQAIWWLGVFPTQTLQGSSDYQYQQGVLSQLSVLGAVLAVFLGWQYVVAFRRKMPSLHPDDVVQWYAGQLLMHSCLAIVLLTVIYINLEDYYPPNHVVSAATSAVATLTAHQLALLQLLFAIAALSFVPSVLDPAADPLDERRRAWAHNLLRLASFTIITLVGLGFFNRLMTWMHASYGPTIYGLFAANGNDAADVIGVIPTVIVCFVVAKVLLRVSQMVESAFFRKATP